MTPGHDLMGLIKFLGREEWKEPFGDVLDEHIGAVAEAFKLDPDEIDEIIGEGWGMTLWGSVFEDFLTREIEPDGRNLAEVYLKRRGWKEDARTRAYIKALRTSVMSLYEVSEIVPGRSLRARDLIRGGEPVLVDEVSATRSLKPWDRIAARIVPKRDGHMFAGALLPFTPEARAMVMDGLRELTGGSDDLSPIDDELLRSAAPLFSMAWLSNVLSKMLSEDQPVVHNSDGEDVMFHTVRFPLADGIMQEEIADRLDTLPDLRRENSTFWNWLDGSPRARSRDGKNQTAMSIAVTMDDGTPVIGNIELKGSSLILTVNSATRAARGTAMLQDILGATVLTPLTEIQTVQQLHASRQGEKTQPSSIPPEIATPIVHGMLDKQYRQVMDEPVGMIGDVSPRDAVDTAEGREKVADWLKLLENRSASPSNPNDPLATYDFGWMWRELGIETLRR